jgi:serine/threonine protein kinase
MAILVVDDSNFRFDAATDPRAPAPRAAGEVGDIIAGRYELRERLGAGGGGTVFRAFDRDLGEEVALKLLGAEVDADAAWRERVRREVKLARRIASHHVCRVFDIGEAAGVRFLTMELIDGESLHALLDRGALPAARGLAIVSDIAEGLAAAHAAGILHRDLKPGNGAMRRDGRAVVVDFGLARAYSPVEISVVEVAGTPGYMSPEQARGEPIDFASDVYSFGITAQEVVGDASVLQPIIARTLARRPADRYSSGKELRADIVAK